MKTYEEVQQRIRAERRTWLVTGAPASSARTWSRSCSSSTRTWSAWTTFPPASARTCRRGHPLHRGRHPLARRPAARRARASTWCCTRRRSAACRARSTARSTRTTTTSTASSTCWSRRATPACRALVFASSSAVFGDDPMLPKVEERIGRAAVALRPVEARQRALRRRVRHLLRLRVDRPALLQRVRPAPGPRRRLRLGDPGVDRRAAARPDRLHQRRRHARRATSATSTTWCRPTCSPRRPRTRPRSTRPTTSRTAR